jgi:AraC-like DNA-binding protein
MLPDITNAIILFGGGLAFLLGFVQLLRPGRSIRNYLLFVIFICITIIQLQEFFIAATPGYSTNAGMMLLLMAKFILGPSLYIFYLLVFKKDYVFETRDFLHLVPAFIALAVVCFLSNGTYSSPGVRSFYMFLMNHSFLDNLHSLGFALILGYVVSILSKMDVIDVVKDPDRDRFTVVAITVMIILFLITSMIIVSLITDNQEYSRTALMLITFFVIYWFIIGQVYPDMVLSFSRKSRKMERVNSIMQGVNIKAIEKKIDEIFVKEKLFCDEDITIKRLASHLDLTRQHFSAYLNHHLEINFNTFINRYRVKESIDIMKDEPERSLISIAFAVGFNSKSVFYEAFTKETGLSPARYRKEKILK